MEDLSTSTPVMKKNSTATLIMWSLHHVVPPSCGPSIMWTLQHVVPPSCGPSIMWSLHHVVPPSCGPSIMSVIPGRLGRILAVPRCVSCRQSAFMRTCVRVCERARIYMSLGVSFCVFVQRMSEYYRLMDVCGRHRM